MRFYARIPGAWAEGALVAMGWCIDDTNVQLLLNTFTGPWYDESCVCVVIDLPAGTPLDKEVIINDLAEATMQQDEVSRLIPVVNFICPLAVCWRFKQ